MIGEFGGLGAFIPGKEWVPNGCYAYEKVATTQALADRYIEMVRALFIINPSIHLEGLIDVSIFVLCWCCSWGRIIDQNDFKFQNGFLCFYLYANNR
jgi:hypothetical protein